MGFRRSGNSAPDRSRRARPAANVGNADGIDLRGSRIAVRVPPTNEEQVFADDAITPLEQRT
jgi:hypothetical protein